MFPAVTNVPEFLYSLYEQQLSYSTIITARSALTSYLMNTDLRDTPYMHGLYSSVHQSPDTEIFRDLGDFSIVLAFTKKWHPLNTLSLKDLTH